MRAVKSVLTAENASVLLLRGLMDVNMAKCRAQDVPLFQVSDFVPLVLPNPDYDLLLKALSDNIAKLNLQPVPWFIGKVIQVYEMMLVCHGFMIVGDPLGGKTSVYKVLTPALGYPLQWQIFTVYSIHSLYCDCQQGMDQLYGCFDPASHEGSDGVLATSFNRQWIIFDGLTFCPKDPIHLAQSLYKLYSCMMGHLAEAPVRPNLLPCSRCSLMNMKRFHWRPLHTLQVRVNIAVY
uniref:Dynein heavy chain hydrolytic ATP-binding dynein motor region domain-containing protein n=1 Tax=Haplochromis burtoni TaxID=8153 RepID=A0A3Q2WX84_HAPBU